MSNVKRPQCPEELWESFCDEDCPSSRPARPSTGRARRIRAIARLLLGVPERQRQQRRRRVFGSVAVAAVLAASVTTSWYALSPTESPAPLAVPSTSAMAPARLSEVRGTVAITHEGKRVVANVNEQRALSDGDEILTTVDSSAALELTGGADIDISPATKVLLERIDADVQWLALDLGRIDVSVPPNVSGRDRLVVQTPDTKVVVHGTVFVVEVKRGAQPGDTITSVRVSRGTVVVLHEGTRSELSGGQSWTTPATKREDPAASESRQAASPSAPPATSPAGAADRQVETLTEQNDLFRRAIRARNRGDDHGALRHLGELLSRYPQSRLAQEVRVERFRALARLGKKPQAIAEAQRYLDTYHNGFARDEARTLTAGAGR